MSFINFDITTIVVQWLYMICNAKLQNLFGGDQKKSKHEHITLHTKTLCGKYWKSDQRQSKQRRIPFLQKLQPSKCWISIYAPIQFVLQVLQRKEIQRVSLRNNASIYKSPPVIQLDSLPSTHINASNSFDSLTINMLLLTINKKPTVNS